jgi:tetratricopeptide (TPR) repeat protein
VGGSEPTIINRRKDSARSCATDLLDIPIQVRVSPHSYLSVLLVSTFFSALFFYLDLDIAAAVLFAASWALLPFLSFRDRISFDGKSLKRTGVMPRLWYWMNGSRRRLKIKDIEQAETQSIRTMKRGGNVRYRYRTIFRGNGIGITISSGSDDYRRMVKSILPRLPDNVLDVRSIELREHLADSKETLMKAEFSQIPSAEVLEGTLSKIRVRAETRVSTSVKRPSVSAPLPSEPRSMDAKVEELQSLGNELRLGGYLLQAIEAFRRALVLKPQDARLLFDFARCLHSLAGVKRDAKLGRKAIAALRLSERRAHGDGDLLARLGEAYFQIGEWRRAGMVFQKVLDHVSENFRAARGLAEMALREGKIAHVIHHFSTANRIAETPALSRWTRVEADYFSHLNADDEYMEMEIARVNLLESLLRSKKTAQRIAFLAFPAIIIGMLFNDDLITNIGWAVSTVSLVIWVGLSVSTKLFDRRIPYEMMAEED